MDTALLLQLVSSVTPLLLLFILPYFLFKLLGHVIGVYRDPDVPSEAVAPKDETYYDARKDGYWVSSADGSKTLVTMNELYPNDVDRINLKK